MSEPLPTNVREAVACSELLACPFCGGPATIEETELAGNVRKSAGCNTEHCQGYQSTLTFATHREAIEAWNKRSVEEKLRRRRIYTDGKRTLRVALEQMTDEWIESGQYCDQTIMNLRDALRVALQANDQALPRP